MDDDQILARLGELGLELPAATPPLASYVPCVVHGATATVAGQLPFLDGAMMNPGSSASTSASTRVRRPRGARPCLGSPRSETGSVGPSSGWRRSCR